MDQDQVETAQDPVGSATQPAGLPEPDHAPDSTPVIFPFEFEEPLPTLEDLTFQEFIFGSPGRASPSYEIIEEECIPITGEQDYASYGDQGTTATLNAYGSIVQITRYLGAGRSGFFSVDLEDVDEPYFVQRRADQLMKRCANFDGIFFAPDFGTCQELDDCYNQPWQLKFVHNRWPQFTSDPRGALVITSQNFASRGTIFQKDRYEAANRRVRVIASSSTRFARNWIKIRELEFLDPGYKFNEQDAWDDYLGPNGFSFILVKKGIVLDPRVTPGPEIPDAVGLICAISVNGKIRELEKFWDEGPCYRVKLTAGEDGFWAGQDEPLEITTAFRLQLMPQRCDWKHCLVSDADFLRPWHTLSANPFQKIGFAGEPRLDLATQRNLEHILSVCSVPVGVVPQPAGTNEETEAVALTCGDIFAFEFLLSMYELIEKRHNDSCKCNEKEDMVCTFKFSKALYTRIKQTCDGHLAWIRQAKLDEAGCFETHYWASGEKIEILQPDREVLSMRSVTDTPFQIIKLADFTRRFGKDNELLRGCLERFIRPWIKKLDEVNRLGFYVFPRPPRTSQREYQNYRLEDHVWIWRALLGVDALGFGNELSEEKRRWQKKKKGQKDKTNEEEAPAETDRLTWDYSPAEFQRHVLRRFTAQNIVSRKRMLAVARSSSENRFLLRARDTALFYETKVPFFNESDSLWKATMDAQTWHEDNQDSLWDSPLRYGLALMMATKGFQMNSKRPDYMSQTAKDCLYQSSAGSGLFPGQINTGTKESEIYDHERWRDFYWHVTFEVPYILWENSKQEEEVMRTTLPQDQDAAPTNRAVINLPIQDQVGGSHVTLEMKRSMPSNSFIEQQSIVEIQDEWLYPYPDFFDVMLGNEISPSTIEEFRREIDPASFIQDAEASFCREHSVWWEDCPQKCVVIDIPKRNHGVKGKRGPQDDRDPENTTAGLCAHSLYQKLKESRTAQDAKKRLVWLPSVDRDTAMLCVFLSPKAERAYLASFFDRSQRGEKYFFDETAATSNLWRTELHLSSFRLLQEGHHRSGSTRDTDLRFLGGGKKLRRSGMSFRFVGDMFDRYWTCHIIGYGPQDDKPSPESRIGRREDEEGQIEVRFRKLINSAEFFHKFEREKKPWRQRKVLELLLFDAMLQNTISGYEELLKEVDSHLRRMLSLGQSADTASSDILSVSNALFSSQMDSHAYLSVSKEWPPFQYTLQIMEEDLQETLEKIGLWRTREEDREPESPRWTRNDESKYRSVISKLKASNVHRIRDIERHLSKIQSLRTALTSRLASIRDDLNFQSAENVRFFTYVTVVFLPLGFAAAIFSMAGAPPRTPLIGMIVTAAIALILTVIALANAQTLDELIFTPGYRALGKFKPSSRNARKRQRDLAVSENQGVPSRDALPRDQENLPSDFPPTTEKPSKGNRSWNLKGLPERYRTFRQRRNKHGGETDHPGLEAGKADS